MPIDKKEIEIKAKIVNYDSLLAKLGELGITLSKPSIQHDQIFWPNGTKFEDLISGTPVLRIREEEGTSLFTLKQRSKERELTKIEKETIIDDAESLKTILEIIGFYKVLNINKSRRTGHHNEFAICIDEVKGLGHFIEVEQMTTGDEDGTVKNLLGFLLTLGVKKADIIEKGYDTLLLHK